MHIKQVIIEGFKSFKQRTVVESFDPRHNVVVGRNGSGKSNFFYALQFVISDEFDNLRPEQRQALLHEGEGQRVLNASVEIIFDNTDGRLPFKHNEVHIRRIIGAKQDQYFIDQAGVSRMEVMNVLESAGFAKCNPYYIVKQGKINQLATDPDSSRLKLLELIAGTQVHADRKMKAVDSLEQTSRKLKVCESRLKDIRVRLNELVGEKAILEKYQEIDKKRRCLEYVICERDDIFSRQDLKELEEAQRVLEATIRKHEMNLTAVHESTMNAKDVIEEAKSNKKIFENEKDQLQTCYEKLYAERARLYFKTKTLENEIVQSDAEIKKKSTTLKFLEAAVAQIEGKLTSLRPTYDAAMEAAAKREEILSAKEEERDNIFAKQNRGSRFRSKEERNVWIETELESLASQIQEKEQQIKDHTEQMEIDTVKCTSLEIKLQKLNRELEKQRDVLAANAQQASKLKNDNTEYHDIKNILWKREDDILKQLDSKSHELNKTEQILKRKLPLNLSRGQESIVKVLESFAKRGGEYAQIPNSYHGILIDNFECRDEFNIAIEAVAGRRLFYHIVRDKETATAIINEMNRMRLPGEVNFIPLNIPNEVYVDHGPGITSILLCIQTNDLVRNALKTIFGRTLLVRDLELAAQTARNVNVNCVTLSGDVASGDGLLKGGYIDPALSRIVLFKNKRSLDNEIKGLNTDLDNVRQQLEISKTTMTDTVDHIQHLLTGENQVKTKCEKLQRQISALHSSIDILKNSLKAPKMLIEKYSGTIKKLRQVCQCLEKEKEEELKMDLSSAERETLEMLNEDIIKLRKIMKEKFLAEAHVKQRKNELENLLLSKQRQKNIEDKVFKEKNEVAEQKKQKRERLLLDYIAQGNSLKKVAQEVEEKAYQLRVAAKKQESSENNLSMLMKAENKCRQVIDQDTKNLDNISSKHILKEEKHNELTLKINSLGTVPPMEMIVKFADLSSPTLLRKLEKVNRELKAYKCVNNKAISQCLVYTTLKEKQYQDYKLHSETHNELMKMVEDVDMKKLEAVEYTFKEVNKHFQDIFKKMVPKGTANLVMYRQELEESVSSPEDSLLDYQFIGVGIEVSFMGDKKVSLGHLSGGQKTLVALALIFAIQKCNPAPFYLFDEIDQALDPKHRAAVAMMIHELSENAQFITTTFRPEFLVHANKCYGVSYKHSTSTIMVVDQQEAANFVHLQTTET